MMAKGDSFADATVNLLSAAHALLSKFEIESTEFEKAISEIIEKEPVVRTTKKYDDYRAPLVAAADLANELFGFPAISFLTDLFNTDYIRSLLPGMPKKKLVIGSVKSIVNRAKKDEVLSTLKRRKQIVIEPSSKIQISK